MRRSCLESRADGCRCGRRVVVRAATSDHRRLQPWSITAIRDRADRRLDRLDLPPVPFDVPRDDSSPEPNALRGAHSGPRRTSRDRRGDPSGHRAVARTSSIRGGCDPAVDWRSWGCHLDAVPRVRRGAEPILGCSRGSRRPRHEPGPSYRSREGRHDPKRRAGRPAAVQAVSADLGRPGEESSRTPGGKPPVSSHGQNRQGRRSMAP